MGATWGPHSAKRGRSGSCGDLRRRRGRQRRSGLSKPTGGAGTQQLAAMREEVLYVIFLDLNKAYDALDRSMLDYMDTVALA